MLGNFSCFCCRLLDFSTFILSKISFRNTIRVSNSLDPDQDWQNVSPDLGPNCLQRSSADDNSLFLLSAGYLLKKFFLDRYQCQIVWIQIGTDILSVLIWVQTVCKGCQEPAKVTASMERVKMYLSDLQEEQETSSSSDESDDEEDTARQKSKPSVSYRLKAPVPPVSAVVNASDCVFRVREFNPSPVPYFCVEIDHEIISVVILLLPLI